MRLRHIVWVSAFLAVSIAAPASAATLPSAATAGIGWLQTQVNADGSLASEAQSIASSLQARSETATAIGLAGPIPASLTDAVASDTGIDTESLSRHVIVLVQSGQNPSAAVQALYANQNADGGFGSLAGDSSDSLDTAFALLALRTANDTSATNLSNALLYMVGSVDPDGGYGLPAGGSGSQVYVTSYVLLAYQAYATSYPLMQQISGARQWLIGQRAGRVYGDTLSDAIGALALAASSSDASAYSGALSALTAGQQADGSWGDDPYLTAMAIRALSVGVAQAAASTGSLTGTVLDATSHLPLAGATVQLSGTASNSAATGASGGFSFNGLLPGTYTVSIGASGYSAMNLSAVQVSAGSATTLGVVLLSASPAAGGLSGVLTDANGAPLAGAVISLSGTDNVTVTSGANGGYSFTGLAPGQVVVTISLSGYDTISVSAQVTAGLVLQFSPSLYPAGATPSAASLSGSVVDALSQQPLAGVTVTIGASSVQTDGTGRFAITGLTPGSYTATVSANGYSGATVSGELAGGANAAGSIALTAQGSADNTSSISGVVIDAANSAPLAGVTVQVQGAAIATITDASGHYQLTGIPGSQFAVVFTAAGYLSHQSGVSLAVPGALVLNAALIAAGSTGIKIQAVSIDQPAYNPYTEAEFDADVVNSTASDQQVALDAKILDALGNVVQDIPAIGTNLSTPLSATLQTVPAAGDLKQGFVFYVRNTLAGNYRILVQATDANGDVVAEGGSAITINELAQIGGGLTLNPPITQANANQAIHVTGTLSNLGNLSLEAGMLQLSVSVSDNAAANSAPTPSVVLNTFYSEGNATDPVGGAKDAQGNIYVVDSYFGGPNFKIHRIAPDKSSTLVATIPSQVTVNGITYSVNNGARSVLPADLAVDPNGTIWVLNSYRFIVRITPAGAISYLDTGIATLRSITSDSSGNLYFTGVDGNNSLLVEMDTGGQFTTLVQNGISKPLYVTATPFGNLYVTNFGDNTVSQISADGTITSFVTGLNGPQGITSDSTGNLYVANSGDNDVLRISATGVSAVYATGFNVPTGLAFDGQGVLYVTNAGDNSVDKVTAGGHVSVFAQSAASNPQGVRFDGQGNLYVANANNNTVTEIDAAGSVHVLASGLSSPHQTALDGTGDLFVTNFNSGAISKISSGSVTTVATGLNQPYGISYDGSSNLYIIESGANRISSMPAAGGPVQTVAAAMLRSPGPMAVAPDGTVVVANSNFIANLPLTGSGQILASTTSQALGLSYDQNGTLYYTLSNSLNKVVNGAGVQVTTIPITRAPAVFDGNGGYYIADFNNKRILHYDSIGASTIFLTLSGNPSWLAGDTAGNLYVVVGNLTVFRVTPSGVATQITNSHFVSGIRTLTVDASGRLIVANSTANSVTVAAPDGSTLAFFGVPVPGGAVGLANGTLAVSDITNHGLRIYSTAGAVQQQMWGFSAPHDAYWANNQLYFDDSFGRFYSLVPGGYPQLLGGGTSSYFSFFQNKLYYTTASSVATFDLATAKNTFYFTMPSGSTIGSLLGVDVRNDGAFAATAPGGDEVVLVSATKQILKTYTGINTPVAVAVDPAGDVFVSARITNNPAVVELSPSGTTAKPVAVLNSAYGLAFDSAGNLLVAGAVSAEGLFQVNLATGNTTPTRIASATVNVDLRGIVFNNGVLYAVDNLNQAVRRLSGSSVPVFASGIASPYGVRFSNDGVLHVVDRTSGNVLRYQQGGIDIVASGMTNAIALGFDPNDVMYVGTSAAGFYKVSAGGQPTDFGIETLLGGSQGIADITFDAAGDPLIDTPVVGALQAVLIPAPPVPPAPGTVVYTTMVPAPSLALDAAPVSVDFGSWTPQYGGDYSFTVTSAEGDVVGSLHGSLHVGSYAQGQLSADAASLPPGDQPLSLSLDLQGLDFTSIAEVEASNISYDVTTNITNVPPSLGVDPDGNLEYMGNGKLVRVAPDGTTTTFTNLGQGQTLYGDLPIDAQGNVLVNATNKILLYSPVTKTSAVYSNLAGVVSMAFGPGGILYAQVGQQIFTVAPDGSFKLFYTSPTVFFGLTADAVGNVFIQTANTIVRVGADGQAGLLSSQLDGVTFEGEGRNVAGACADNLFFTPGYAPSLGQTGEEHTLIEYVGDTGQIAPIFNGLTISSDLGDMDFIAYDRFHSMLMTWTDDTNGKVFALPVLCGGIDVEAHVVTAPGQTLNGFSAAPVQAISHVDGTTEYVWDLQSVTTIGQGLQFGTVLSGLQIGDTRSDVQSAFLEFKNSFVAGNTVTLPLNIPTVHVDPVVSVTPSTDQSSYPDATPVNVSVGLHNSSVADVSGLLDVKILAADGSVAADIDTQTADVPAGASVVEPALWNTGGYLDGAYSVSATLRAADGTLLAQGVSAFSIGVTAGPAGPLTAGVTTDKASYSPTDLVTITDRLTDSASNSLDGNVALATSVTGPDGSPVWSSNAAIGQLVPGAIRDLPYQLPLANAAPGTYTVTLAATLDGAPLPTATAHFTVQSSSDTASGVAGTLSVTPTQAPISTVVHLSGTVTDNGNAPLGSLTATLAILDPVAGQLVFQSPVSAASLAQGASLPLQADWTAAGTAHQTYVAILMVSTGGASKTLAQANLTLLPPPDPTANLTGTLGASPSQVIVGNSVNLAGAVDNPGVQVTGITTTITVQDAGGNTVYQNQADLGPLAAGSSTPVLASWNGGAVNQTYTVYLSVSGSGKTKTLAQTQFSVVPPPVSMAASLGLGQHGRVLILTDAQASSDPNGPSGAPGVTAQNQHLASVLQAAGWSYKIVTNAADFETQFDTGGYEVYVVLSEAVKLPTQLQLQLDQAVANGAGLIVAGNHDDRNNKLETALGVHSTGKNLSVSGITLPSSALEQSGGQAGFGIDGQPLSMNKATALVLGSFTLTDGSTAPAVFSNAYGAGKTLYFAFDLALEQAETPGGFLDQLLTDSLGYVHPATLTPYAGRVIPLVLSIQNQGEATPAVSTLSLPTGASVMDPNGAAVSGSTVSWVLDLAVGETTTETVWIKLPATSGSITVSGEVDSGVSPALTPQAEPSLVIGVQTKP